MSSTYPGFTNKILYAFISFLMFSTCPIHLILLDFVTLVIFGKEYNLSSHPLVCRSQVLVNTDDSNIIDDNINAKHNHAKNLL